MITQNKKSLQSIINYTNMKLKHWYMDVEKDYGIRGSGQVRFTDDTVIIDYIEDNEIKHWSMAFYPSYIQDQKLDWVFNCWQELA